MKDIRNDFFDDICKLLEDARKNVKKAVNLAMVYSYCEVGWKIVEEEQNGEDRVQYGQYIVKELSEYLTQSFGKGFSVTNLKQMRQFYCVYSQDQIGQTLSDQFINLPTASTGRKFFLSWVFGIRREKWIFRKWSWNTSHRQSTKIFTGIGGQAIRLLQGRKDLLLMRSILG